MPLGDVLTGTTIDQTTLDKADRLLLTEHLANGGCLLFESWVERIAGDLGFETFDFDQGLSTTTVDVLQLGIPPIDPLQSVARKVDQLRQTIHLAAELAFLIPRNVDTLHERAAANLALQLDLSLFAPADIAVQLISFGDQLFVLAGRITESDQFTVHSVEVTHQTEEFPVPSRFIQQELTFGL